jgi:hypothetical protein
MTTTAEGAAPQEGRFRAGDWVEVRSKEEILQTLDKQGRLDNMPFMPGMFAYCGRRLQVRKSAHKSCDTINWTGGRRVSAAVHLEDVRCDGTGYDGCQAGCLIFWKDAWLKRADGPGQAPIQIKRHGSTSASPLPGGCTEEDVTAATRAPAPPDARGPVFACQGTELYRASEPLKWWDFRQYVEDYRSGNEGIGRLAEGFVFASCQTIIKAAERSKIPLVRGGLVAVYDRVQALRGGRPWPRHTGNIPSGQKTPSESLGLRVGEQVRVKSYQEILTTLDWDNKNRGLYFDAEHVPYCGGTYRVHSVVHKIIEEKTGKMLNFKLPSIILDGVTCASGYSHDRMFCPRAVFPYWREIWLERVEPAPAPAAS